MSKVFENIQVERTNTGWLPVRRLFGEAVKHLEGKSEERVNAVRNLMQELLQGMPTTAAAGIEQVPRQPEGQLAEAMDSGVIAVV